MLKKNLYILLVILILISSIVSFSVNEVDTIGPESGALVIAGGGSLGEEIINRFLELAGGPDSPIVLIPTASGREQYDEDFRFFKVLMEAGATNVIIVHTYDPAIANTSEFIEPITKARGVWFSGGRQWRLTDAYLNTLTHTELNNLLERGGVIGGTSAGASVQASYMVRGAPEGNRIMMAEGHEEGLGFIKNSAIDQHVDTRDRFSDMIEVLEKHPELFGIGLYESTAIVVKKDIFEVIGMGKVAIYDNKRSRDPGEDFYLLLNPGEMYDLISRKVIPGNMQK